MKNFTITTSLRFGHDAMFLCLVPPFPTLILVSKGHEHNAALMAHELWHLEQYKKRPFTYAFKMMFDKNFRLASELECYAKQLNAKSLNTMEAKWFTMDVFARHLATNYNLDITVGEALTLLKNRLKIPMTNHNPVTYWCKQAVAAALVTLLIGVLL